MTTDPNSPRYEFMVRLHSVPDLYARLQRYAADEQRTRHNAVIYLVDFALTALGYPDALPSESTEAHPGPVSGPWQAFEDCPVCGTHKGYACVDMDHPGWPGKKLGHAHTARKRILMPPDGPAWETT